MKHLIPYIAIAISTSVFASCKKMIEVGPPKTQLTPEKAFANDQAAVAVISNVYALFNLLIEGHISPLLGIYTDELSTTSANSSDLEFYNGFVSPANTENLNIWKNLYSVIYQSNALQENIDLSPGMTSSTKKQLKAEARFLRALAYFYLVNLYGDVPLLLTTEVSSTSTATRTPSLQVYSQIIGDLQEAEDNLTESYPSSDKVRANKWTAASLLARVQLYKGDWSASELKASSVITSGTYLPLEPLGAAFLMTSKETILQFWTQDGFTQVALQYLPSSGSLPTYPVTQELINSFETSDNRKAMWIDSIQSGTQAFHYPFKYKNRTPAQGGNEEYLVAFRLGELYLIRSEARVRQGNMGGAISDLNTIRSRAGLPDFISTVESDILNAIYRERKHELFAEWGHRFFDLKRSDQINQIMSGIKPGWRDASALLPIPQYELLNNPNLTQNSGY